MCAFLKKEREGYKPKKSRVLLREQFDTFLSDASDEKYLTTKVIKLYFVFHIVLNYYWGMLLQRISEDRN